MEGYCCYKFPNTADFYEIKGKIKTFEKTEELIGSEGFVMTPFSNNKSTNLFLEGKASEGLSIDEIGLYNTSNSFPSTSKNEFKLMFDKTMLAIESGKAKKIVLSKIKTLALVNSFNVVSFIKVLAKNYPSAFVYLFVYGQICWLGVSPELLIKFNEGETETVALAGTISDNQNKQFTSKENEEQAIITRYIKNILNNNGINNYLQSGTEEIKAGHLKHLATSFSFNSDLKKALRLVSELHPTPAVCGMPKLYSQLFISQTEFHERSYYSGFLGPFNSNSFSFYVNLRCAQVFKQKIVLYAGAGITNASVFENEWNETENKLRILSMELDS